MNDFILATYRTAVHHALSRRPGTQADLIIRVPRHLQVNDGDHPLYIHHALKGLEGRRMARQQGEQWEMQPSRAA